MENKLFNKLCPKCGELVQHAEIVKAGLGLGLHVNMSCEHGHKWTEFYTLSYQGFWWDGKLYDSYGNERKD